jgi:hypothetical protein
VRDLGFRLYRRVVEIRDGQLELRRFVHQRVIDTARQLCVERQMSEEETAIVVEAAAVAYGLHAKARAQDAEEDVAEELHSGGADLATEAAHLAMVVACLQRSPLIPDITARVERELADTQRRRTSPTAGER